MDLIIVTSGVLLHVALGRWISSPWLVPDLTLVSLVLALRRSRSVEPMRTVVITSLLAMAFTVHHPFHAAGAYLVVGWGIKTLMSRLWYPPSKGEATRGFLPLISIGIAEALLLVIVGTPLVFAVMRWVVTCGCSVPVILLMSRRLA